MKGIRFREPIFGQLRDLLPRRAVFLTASPERSLPKFGDEEAECSQRLIVGRHGMVVEVALDDLSQPFPLDRDRLGAALPQTLFVGLCLCRPARGSPLHGGRTRSDGSCPDVASVRTLLTAHASPPESGGRRPRARSRQ